jgi:membrane protein DedA with SNARE-associated domain
MFDSLVALLQSLQGWPACPLVFGILAASGFGLPMNEDILLLTAAALTLSGVMAPAALVVSAWCGLVVADALIFHWGRVFGTRLVEHRLLSRAIPPARLAAMQSLMRRTGPVAIFAARFMLGVRSAVYFAAGSLRLPYRQQLVFDGVAAAIELPLLVYAVRYVGGRWNELPLPSTQVQLAAGVMLAVVAAVAWRVVRRRRQR